MKQDETAAVMLLLRLQNQRCIAAFDSTQKKEGRIKRTNTHTHIYRHMNSFPRRDVISILLFSLLFLLYLQLHPYCVWLSVRSPRNRFVSHFRSGFVISVCVCVCPPFLVSMGPLGQDASPKSRSRGPSFFWQCELFATDATWTGETDVLLLPSLLFRRGNAHKRIKKLHSGH